MRLDCLDQTRLPARQTYAPQSVANHCGGLANAAFHWSVMEPWRDIIKSKSRQNWARPPGNPARSQSATKACTMQLGRWNGHKPAISHSPPSVNQSSTKSHGERPDRQPRPLLREDARGTIRPRGPVSLTRRPQQGDETVLRFNPGGSLLSHSGSRGRLTSR